MKDTYITPDFEIQTLDAEDIVTFSLGDLTGANADGNTGSGGRPD